MGPIELTFMAVVGGLSLAEFIDIASHKGLSDVDDDDGNDPGPNLGVVGPDGTITYDASDASDGRLQVNNVTEDDDIDAFGGSKNDFAYTGDGDDSLRMGDGNDTAFVGGGDDTVFLGNGNDYLKGSLYDSNDTPTHTASGKVLAHGGWGDDTLSSHDGGAVLHGELGDDVLFGSDSMNEGDGADTLYGGWGNDYIAGDDGDTMHGGEGGQDVFVVIPYSTDDDPVMISDFGNYDERYDGDGNYIGVDKIADAEGHGEKIYIHFEAMIENDQLGLGNAGQTDRQYLDSLTDDAAREAALDDLVTQDVSGTDVHIKVNGQTVAIVEGAVDDNGNSEVAEDRLLVSYGDPEDLVAQ